jgi:hypothetical protein
VARSPAGPHSRCPHPRSAYAHDAYVCPPPARPWRTRKERTRP